MKSPGQELPAAPVEDPFTVLGIAPTESIGDVKRAYFAALPKHPPHSDPMGFRRIRDAYERLLQPGALATLAWSATFDRDAALRALEARLAPRLAARQRERSEAEGTRALRATLERAITTGSWAELTTAFGPKP